MGWQRKVGRVANYLEGHFDAFMHAYARRFDSHRIIQILPYRGFGSTKQVYLKGRVLKDKKIPAGKETDSRWRNFISTFKRFNSSEIPEARIAARFQGALLEMIADKEGFFDLTLTASTVFESNQLWHEVSLELLDSEKPVRETGHILIPPASARFGVISDMDDTIIQTDSAHLLHMAGDVLFGNAHTRSPFPGVAGFYNALQGKDGNPLFYVSSSPWNLYDLISDFFLIHKIPIGPLFLRDWGVSENEVLPTSHRLHKLQTLKLILNTLPDLPFILIGDSGQEDPEIYKEIVDLCPGRILAIYIRNVRRNSQRAASIECVANAVRDAGSELILIEDTSTAAAHAASQGWI